MNLNLFYKLMNFIMYLMSSNQYRQYLFYNRKTLGVCIFELNVASVWFCLVTSMIRYARVIVTDQL